jgi:hypothetical protein
MTIFHLYHDIDFSGSRPNWLGYSHGQAPVDRQVISDAQDPWYPQVRLAKHYFLTDFAHNILNSGYTLTFISYKHWRLEIADRAQAAVFKLAFL